MSRIAWGVLLVLAAFQSGYGQAQLTEKVAEGTYDRRQSVSVFAEYSNDSSRIITAYSGQRKIAALGFTYDHRILAGKHVTYHLFAEVRPVFFLRDPTAYHSLLVLTSPVQQSFEYGYFANTPPPNQNVPDGTPLSSCVPNTITQSQTLQGTTLTGTQYNRCGSRWSYGGAVSPFGQKVSFRPASRVQPFVLGNVGFIASKVNIPIDNSSSFNFSAEFGGGLEFYQNHRSSFAIEYRYHHLSNAQLGDNNPGVDSGLFKVTYTYGR